MKKQHSKFLILLAPILVSPVILFSTSCNGFNSVTLKYLGNGTKSFGSYANCRQYGDKFYKFYYGNKTINKGNYVVFLGCSGTTTVTAAVDAHGTTNDYVVVNPGLTLFDDSTSTWGKDETSNVGLLQNNEDSLFVQSNDEWRDAVESNYNINYFSYFASTKQTNYLNGYKPKATETQSYNFCADPFYKWTEDDFLNRQWNPTSSKNDETLEYKKQNSWEQHHQIGHYARNDESAKTYRSLFLFLQQLSPATFSSDNIGTSSVIALYYVNGKATIATKYGSSDNPVTNFKSDLLSTYPNPKL